jgi:hypothetical protein
MPKHLIACSVLILLFSCSPSVTRIGYEQIDTVEQKPESDIPIIMSANLEYEDSELAGEIEIGENGFSTGCGAMEIQKLLRQEAQLADANLINLVEVKPPDIWSTCYRVKALFLKLNDHQSQFDSLVNAGHYVLGEKEKYFEGVPIDSLSVPIPDLRFSIGYELTHPQSALNTHIYYRGFLFRYAYGSSRSTGDPDKLITDVKNAHHLKLSLTFASLQGPMGYAPIYLGFGKSYINEKKNVQGFTGNGQIVGTHYFAGIYFMSYRRGLPKHIGVYFEIGGSSWNFDNSVLYKNNADLKYQYMGLHMTLGVNYHLY